MAPRMIVVAGPPGSGKSSLYPLASFNVVYFNADDRAAELNGGSYIGISKEIRNIVNAEFETFVLGSIERRVSFAIEFTDRVEEPEPPGIGFGLKLAVAPPGTPLMLRLTLPLKPLDWVTLTVSAEEGP